MSPIGHCAVALASKCAVPKVPLGILLFSAVFLDVLAVALAYRGIEGSASQGAPWSHGLFMSAVWSCLAALLALRVYRSVRAGIAVGLMVFSHWILDLISHPIPFNTFSWRSWTWTYGHPLRSDLPLLFSNSPRVGFGLYNSMSAVQATLLEVGMFVLGALVYVSVSWQRRHTAILRREQ